MKNTDIQTGLEFCLNACQAIKLTLVHAMARSLTSMDKSGAAPLQAHDGSFKVNLPTNN